MLRKITIRNFQCHKRLEVSFDPSVTTVVGPSDTGKSAVIRALLWVCTNRPSGAEFIRHGRSKCEVALELDGHVVKRVRGKEENAYYLDGRKYVAMGLGVVPEEIAQVLNVCDTNFQRQLDPPFWFLDTPGQVSKNLNQIVNLGSIDETLASVNSEYRKAKSVADVTQERLTLAKGQLDELSFVPELEEKFATLLEKERAWQETAQNAAALQILLDEASQLQRAIKTRNLAVSSGVAVLELGRQYGEKRVSRRQLEKLATLLESYTKTLRRPVPDLGPLLILRQEADQFAERRRVLELLIEEAQEARQERKRLRKELAQAEEALNKLVPEVCPTCNQPIRRSAVELSPSPSETSTSAKKHRPRVPLRRTGSPPKRAT